MHRFVRSQLALLILIWLIHLSGAAATPAAAEPAPRAKPPDWSSDVLDVFFDDAREVLRGQRPDEQPSEAVVETTARSASADQGTSAATDFAWSQLIDAETLETEVKRLNPLVAEATASPSEFKGAGYKLCRRDFSLLAVLFAVAGEYDGQVRWQDVGPGLRDVFARAGRNAKVGTDSTFREATERRHDLEELIRGGRPQVSRAEPSADWPQVADRPPLMQRMNQSHRERLKPWLADQREFRQHRDDVRHEGQLVAVIAEVISRKGFEFSEDEEYGSYARRLRQAATDMAAAAAADDYQRAGQAMVRMTGACSDCHDGYRG